MNPKFITLDQWVKDTYGEAVSIRTARRWADEGKILPTPEKHGRAYFVQPSARYHDGKSRLTLTQRITLNAEAA